MDFILKNKVYVPLISTMPKTEKKGPHYIKCSPFGPIIKLTGGENATRELTICFQLPIIYSRM